MDKTRESRRRAQEEGRGRTLGRTRALACRERGRGPAERSPAARGPSSSGGASSSAGVGGAPTAAAARCAPLAFGLSGRPTLVVFPVTFLGFSCDFPGFFP